MDDVSSNKKAQLNSVVLMAVVVIAVNVTANIPDFEKSLAAQLITVATSKGAFDLIAALLFWAIDHLSFALRIYWGSAYIDGIWSYEYTREGARYIGVWEIKQTVNGTSVVGSGLDEHYRMRTIVRSVSPMFSDVGGYVFINSRNELATGSEVFSKTTLLLDKPIGFPGRVSSMRGITVVYGGPSDRQLHPDVTFRRHSDVATIDDLIEKLKRIELSRAQPVPAVDTAHLAGAAENQGAAPATLQADRLL